MKPTRHILLLAALLLGSLAASAHDFTVGGIYYNIKSTTDLTAEVTFKGDYYGNYSGEYSGSITVPATVTHNGVEYSVTSIRNDAFRECSSLTAITLPEGVTSIGKYAFVDCSSLTSISIPESVTSIENGAFAGCSSLAAIIVEEGNEVYDSRNGCNAIIETNSNTLIQGCSTTIIPESVTSIGDEAFGWCYSLTAITLPEGVTSIGVRAFAGCSSLTDITIPENSKLTSIGEYAFSYCSGLTDITIPESVTSIGDDAFYGCSSLTAIIVEEGNEVYDSRNGCNAIIETNSNTLIRGCSTTIIPESVTSIGDDAFRGCESLTAITIPEGVTSIGSYAFEYCSSLTSITLPESVTNISVYAFSGCSSLTAITLPENSQLTSIGEYAFRGCKSLTAITIPEGVTSIGDYTFYKCSSLTTITLPEGVTSIRVYAFYECSSLTTITLPEGVTNISVYAFSGCSSLTTITCEALTPPTVYSGTFKNVNKSIPVYVPAGSVEAYKVAGGWSEFTNIARMPIPITHITLSQSSATLLVDESLTLTATVAPDNATDKTLTWSSSNPSVATVDDMGKVTAIAPGTATITATANDGSEVSAQCEVTVRLSTNKNYRIKNVSTDLYLQVSGNNTNMTLQSKAEGVEPTQVFQLEDAGDGMYYIKAADGENSYYAHASTWNFNATSDASSKTPFTIALIDSETEVYTIHQSISSHTGLAGSDASGVGSAIYCNKGVDNNGKWCFETLTEEENTAYFVALTAATRALLDAAIARAEEVVANRSEVLTAEEVAAINIAVQAAKDSKDDAVEEAELNALTNAVSEAVDAAVYVWSLDELNSNTSYAVATEDRGAWYAQSERLNSTVKVEVEQDIADTKQQFAFVKSPTTNACYLYSVGEEKFVKVEDNYTALTETPVHTISFLEGTRSSAFPWVVAFNADGAQKQLGVSNGYDYGVITNWNNLNDMGNTVRIEKVAAFDASEALALIDILETSIEKTGIASQNSGIIFDLQGRRVEKAEKGIYIVGGRKLVIK